MANDAKLAELEYLRRRMSEIESRQRELSLEYSGLRGKVELLEFGLAEEALKGHWVEVRDDDIDFIRADNVSMEHDSLVLTGPSATIDTYGKKEAGMRVTDWRRASWPLLSWRAIRVADFVPDRIRSVRSLQDSLLSESRDTGATA